MCAHWLRANHKIAVMRVLTARNSRNADHCHNALIKETNREMGNVSIAQSVRKIVAPLHIMLAQIKEISAALNKDHAQRQDQKNLCVVMKIAAPSALLSAPMSVRLNARQNAQWTTPKRDHSSAIAGLRKWWMLRKTG